MMTLDSASMVDKTTRAGNGGAIVFRSIYRQVVGSARTRPLPFYLKIYR